MRNICKNIAIIGVGISGAYLLSKGLEHSKQHKLELQIKKVKKQIDDMSAELKEDDTLVYNIKWRRKFVSLRKEYTELLYRYVENLR